MQLRYYQSEAVEAAFGYLCSQAGNPVIVLPTGSGKSLVSCELAKRALSFNGRVVVVTHVKELVEQVDATMQRNGLDSGVYSAGLKRKETEHNVIVAGIQSVFRKAAELGDRKLLIIDECHRVSRHDESMYGQFINDLRSINPKLRIVGLSATPFRLDCGSICSKAGIFQSICYESNLKRLIAEGYLSNITNKPTATNYDTSGLHLRGGEFIQQELEGLFGDQGKTIQAVSEIVNNFHDRKSVIVFCSGVSHAYTVADLIQKITGQEVGVVEGETLALERAETIRRFKEGSLRWLVNMDVLTTGFDAPNTDGIAVLRATMSPGLFAQIVGRGLRTHPGKKECVVLDFGDNIKRHGPIDAIDYGKGRSSGVKIGEADCPEKECPSCLEMVAVGVRTCECGFRFPPPASKITEEGDTQSKILSEPEVFEVVEAYFGKHLKKNAENPIPTLRVDYKCNKDGGDYEYEISEWVCIEHEGFARSRAIVWWMQHSLAPFPKSVDEAVSLCEQGAVGVPRSITAQREGKFWRVLSAVMEELPEVWGVSEEEQEVPF